MPQQTDEGVPVRIASVNERGGSLIGRKLRLAGRYVGLLCVLMVLSRKTARCFLCRNMCYDENTGCLVLIDNGIGVLVDLTLALERERTFSWMKDSYLPLQVVGYLEQSKVSWQCSDLAAALR